ncbi:hypothetical protein ACWD3Z_46720 [Streptomyces sp. NPDC002740]
MDQREQVTVATEERAVDPGLPGDAAHADRRTGPGGLHDGGFHTPAAAFAAGSAAAGHSGAHADLAVWMSGKDLPMRGMPSITLRLRRTTATASPI